MLIRLAVSGLKLITPDSTTTVANFGGSLSAFLLPISLTITVVLVHTYADVSTIFFSANSY